MTRRSRRVRLAPSRRPVKRRRRQQRGGMMPWVVDVKKGFELIKDPKLWQGLSRTQADRYHDRRLVDGYKAEYARSKVPQGCDVCKQTLI